MDIKISAFKKVTDSNNPYNRDIFKSLNRIKEGASKEAVLKYRETKEEKYKTNLPGYCFSGVFSHRMAIGLKKHSGLITLDFDKFDTEEDAEIFKDSISSEPFIFSAFISPGGKGVKALVKIPPIEKDHKLYYNALFKHFNDEHLDISGSDVSRFCFESYDPNIYINSECETWLEKEEENQEDIGFERKQITIPLTSENQIIQKLQVWFDKKYKVSSVADKRNTNVFKFAAALNDFGIPQHSAESHLYQYAVPGTGKNAFNEKEIEKVIKSAYKRGLVNFGTKFFEDKKLKNEIEKAVRSGKKNNEIKKKLEKNNINVEDFNDVVEDIKEDLEVSEFWYYDDKNKIKLSPHKFKFYLEQNNFLKYFPTDSQTFTFIKKEQNLIEETNEKRIKDYVLEDLMTREEIGYGPYDFMAANTGYFNINYLSMLDSANIKLKEDTKDECFLYYKNCAVRITKNSHNEIDYLDLDGYVWKNQIIDREYERIDHHSSEFRKFIWLVSGQNVDKYNSFKSVLGYMLHSFKTSSKNKAIILNDETISDNPNGGSGKGLLWNALSKMKKISMIDGKTFDFNKSFPYQTVSTDCQVLVFDDVKRNFNFESLFSVITEGITIEYKGQDAIKIPVEKSPKILITTNYTVGGIGGSFERRKFEVEMSSYFGYHHTPEDEFNHMLFDEWDNDEWRSFDSYMINCLQYYLENGLVEHEFNNLETRKFINITNMEFYEWSKDNITSNIRTYKGETYDNFIDEYPDYGPKSKYKLSQKRFRQYLEEYSKFYGLDYLEGKDAKGRWFEIIDKDKPRVEKEEELEEDLAF